MKQILQSAKFLLTILAFLWILEGIDTILLGGILDNFGIHPRQIVGLPAIFLAPFLHGGFFHLASNSLPFLIFGMLCITDGMDEFITVVLSAMLISGIGTWLMAPSDTVHIGASGVIFGMFGYLLMKGFFTRKFFPILISLIVAIAYGGLIRGVLPTQPGISWQSHLFGFVGGVLCARLMAKKLKMRE